MVVFKYRPNNWNSIKRLEADFGAEWTLKMIFGIFSIFWILGIISAQSPNFWNFSAKA